MGARLRAAMGELPAPDNYASWDAFHSAHHSARGPHNLLWSLGTHPMANPLRYPEDPNATYILYGFD